ncbi:MAG: nuclear transport factor 2 family protein [Ignavibacteriales bacterium]|nr:nuclear transport factor 2 family protein [Ignavibacteriales bacterium]
MEGIEEFIDQKIMGFGTTLDEKILSISEYRKLVTRQREQGKDIKMQFDIIPVVHKIAADGNSAVFVDEIILEMIIDNNTQKIFIRLSSVLEFRDQKWIVVHWHGSKPDYEEGESDSWHVDEWKKKNAELEKAVEEKLLTF